MKTKRKKKTEPVNSEFETVFAVSFWQLGGYISDNFSGVECIRCMK